MTALLGMPGQNPLPSTVSPGAGGAVSDRKQSQWTEADVLALPAGEHDEFERKGGRAFGQNLHHTLGKALSAFATSKGGHLVFGVENNGVIDGVDAKKGNTSTRQWLEQIVPARVDPRLQDFRVHEVIPAIPSTIPAGRVVIVIDISESRQNHQSTQDHVYYHRVGGHSMPAPHAYLDARSVRLTQPRLVGRVAAVAPVRTYGHADHVFVELKIDVEIRNIGPVAATHWQFIPEMFTGLPEGRQADYVSDRRLFPNQSGVGGLTVGDATLYPDGLPSRKQVDLGVRFRPATPDEAGIQAEIDALFPPECALQFRVASLVDGGTTIEGLLAPFVDRHAIVDSTLKTLGKR